MIFAFFRGRDIDLTASFRSHILLNMNVEGNIESRAVTSLVASS